MAKIIDFTAKNESVDFDKYCDKIIVLLDSFIEDGANEKTKMGEAEFVISSVACVLIEMVIHHYCCLEKRYLALGSIFCMMASKIDVDLDGHEEV